MLAPKRELPLANAKCIALKMVPGEQLDGRTLMLNMVVGRGMLTLIGEAIGISVTALLSPVLSRFLYGVSRVDPLIEKLFYLVDIQKSSDTSLLDGRGESDHWYSDTSLLDGQGESGDCIGMMKPLAIHINPALNRDVTPTNSAQIACYQNFYSESARVNTFTAQTTFTTAFPFPNVTQFKGTL